MTKSVYVVEITRTADGSHVLTAEFGTYGKASAYRMRWNKGGKYRAVISTRDEEVA